MTTRREFLAISAVAAAGWTSRSSLASCLSGDAAFAQDGKAPPVPARKMNILFLGGTGFLGPHQVEYAMKRGHTVTLFNRGKTHPQLFSKAEKLQGDRMKSDYESLKKACASGRKWDVVIDNSGYVPREVRESIVALKDHIDHYIFVSTISVYGPGLKPGMDESAPVAEIANKDEEKVTGETYGALKALCEAEAMKGMNGACCNIRPTLIVGPGDDTDRFTYWPVRLDRGGEVLCPGDGEDPVQVIDVRDLAEFCIHVAEAKGTGTMNAAGPAKTLTMKEMIRRIQDGIGSKATPVWAPVEFLEANRVSAWQDMPVWIPRKDGESAQSQVSIARALKAGLAFRPLEDTAVETLKYAKSRATDTRPRRGPAPGLVAEREAELLKKLHEAAPKK
jgi:2'-hydroxyisoflavone reductase